jgi:hypothetical protein
LWLPGRQEAGALIPVVVKAGLEFVEELLTSIEVRLCAGSGDA